MSLRKIFRVIVCPQNVQRLKILFSRSSITTMKKFFSNHIIVSSGSPTLISLWGFKKIKDSTDNSPALTKEILIAKVDALYENGEYEKIYDMLNSYRDHEDVEILWRLCRALYNMAKTASDIEAKKFIYDAYNLIMSAVSINGNHWAVHKWMAILIDSKSNYEGMKERLKQLDIVKEHMLKATQLNPNDATILYMLGNWCYSVADLTWYQRKIASAIFGKVPESSFNEALEYLEKAEKIDPMFYSYNLLLLAKTYLKLQRKEDAIKYLKMTAEFPAHNDEDQKAKQEASKILGLL